MNSPEGELSVDALEVVSTALEKADVDARRRKIVWEDGQRLSITQSVQRIHAEHPDLPLALIETHLIGWLEMGFAPETYSPRQLDELDRLTEKWIEDHQRQPNTQPKQPRNRHS